MNSSFAAKHRNSFQIKPSLNKIMNADSHITDVDGEVDCEISFEDTRTYRMTIMVMKQSDEWDILLGNDFMEIDKPSILIASRQLVFPDGAVVKFINDDDDYTPTSTTSNLDYLDAIYNIKIDIGEPENEDVDEDVVDFVWGENDTSGTTNSFEKYFKKNGSFLVKDSYSLDEKNFINNYRDITYLIPKNILEKRETRKHYSEIPPSVTSEVSEELFKLIAKNYDIFADDLKDLGKCNYSPFRILTTKVTPIYKRPYRMTKNHNEVLSKHIQELLDLKLIKKSRSPWSSPAFIVDKKNGEPRLVIDYRDLNQITKSHPFPMPRIVDLFDQMTNSKYFSLLDLKSGFNQVTMHPNSMEKTAFQTPDGHFEWTVLPFGLKNAPAEFCRMMHNILGNKPNVIVYLDDICIHTDTIEKHLEVLNIVFNKLRKINLMINSKKVSFLMTSIKLLGHVVSHNKVALDVDKIVQIQKASSFKCQRATSFSRNLQLL